MKQNVLATIIGSLVVVLCTFGTGLGETLDAVAEQALASGDTATAITRIESQIQTDPTYHYNYYILGRIFYERERWSQARDYFQTAQDKKSKFYESLQYLGLSELQLGNLDQAAKAFDRGLDKARDMKADFEYCMGLLQMARKEYQEADRSLRRALSQNDSVAEYHIALGDINFYQGIPALAVSEYEKALNLDTAGTEVYFHWAEACLEMKDYTCAIEKLRIVLSKDSTFARAWHRAGGIYFKAARSTSDRDERTQRFMDAIGSYERYVSLTQAQPDSASVRAFFETGLAYYNLRRYEDAVGYFVQVLNIPYEPRDIYFFLGKSLWGVRDYVHAAEVLLKHDEWANLQGVSYNGGVDADEFNKLLGDCFFYRKGSKAWTPAEGMPGYGLTVDLVSSSYPASLDADYYNASKYYKRSLEANPDQERLLQNIAVSYHNMKRYPEAIQYYDLRIAQGMDSGSAAIYKNAALCALHIAGTDEDEAELEEELEEDIDGEGMAEDNSLIDPTLNYHEVAVAYMNKYLEFRPTDTTIVERVANTYLYQLSDCANGVAAFQKLLELDPNNCQAKKSLGFAYFGGDICNKDLDKTLRYLNQAYDCLNNACADAALVKWIAQAYHLRAVAETGDSNSDYKNAFEWYGKVLKCTPGDDEAKKGQEDTRFEFN